MRRLPQREEFVKPELTDVLEHYGTQVHFKSGRGMANCFLHDDRTPSLSVDLTKQVVKCHSCGFGGDSITIIEKKEGTDFRGARAFVATQSFAAGVASRGDEDVPSGAYGLSRGGSVARRKGHREGRRSFRPSWSRES